MFMSNVDMWRVLQTSSGLSEDKMAVFSAEFRVRSSSEALRACWRPRMHARKALCSVWKVPVLCIIVYHCLAFKPSPLDILECSSMCGLTVPVGWRFSSLIPALCPNRSSSARASRSKTCLCTPPSASAPDPPEPSAQSRRSMTLLCCEMTMARTSSLSLFRTRTRAPASTR